MIYEIFQFLISKAVPAGIETDRHIAVRIYKMIVLQIILEEVGYFQRLLVSQIKLKCPPTVPAESNGTRPFLYRSHHRICFSVFFQSGTPVVKEADKYFRGFYFFTFQCTMCFRITCQRIGYTSEADQRTDIITVTPSHIDTGFPVGMFHRTDHKTFTVMVIKYGCHLITA